MTQVVTVNTDFTDLNQMAAGLVGRVDPLKVILPGPDSVDAGEWVQFAITLQDGTPGFAGIGRCVTAVDNGEERSSHQRFDVVLDSLQFDPRGQQVFEHILSLSGYGAEPVDAIEDANADDVYTDGRIAVPTEAQEIAGYAEEDQTLMEDGLLGDMSLSLSPEPDGEQVDESMQGGAFGSEPPTGSRRGLEALVAEGQPNGAHYKNGGVFVYAGGLPFPSAPPRPTIDPSQKVLPAPRPAKPEAEADGTRCE